MKYDREHRPGKLLKPNLNEKWLKKFISWYHDIKINHSINLLICWLYVKAFYYLFKFIKLKLKTINTKINSKLEIWFINYQWTLYKLGWFYPIIPILLQRFHTYVIGYRISPSISWELNMNESKILVNLPKDWSELKKVFILEI